jgi:hypothetical protein
MKIIRPIVYNWEGQIEQTLLDKENQSIDNKTNKILEIIDTIIDESEEIFEYHRELIYNLDKKIDKLNDRVTNIEGDVKINRKLIDAMYITKKD